MSDKLLQLFYKHDRYKFSKPNMARNLSDLFPIERDQLFNSEKVVKAVTEIVDAVVHEKRVYNAEECSRLCVSLSEDIRKCVKEFEFKRYKIVCLVQIFEKKNQSISSVARLLCDVERDRYVVIKKENNNFYLIASVYGLYFP